MLIWLFITITIVLLNMFVKNVFLKKKGFLVE